MPPQHHRQVEKIERAGDAKADVEPVETGEQSLQAEQGGGGPEHRADHHRRGGEQAALPSGDGGGLHDQHGRRAGACHRQQVDDG
jgi:hypothetical protein